MSDVQSHLPQTQNFEHEEENRFKKIRSKTLTRTKSILQNDVSLINHYARKYSIQSAQLNNSPYEKYRKQSGAMGLYTTTTTMSPLNILEDVNNYYVNNDDNDNNNNNSNNNNNNYIHNNNQIKNDNYMKKNSQTPFDLINNTNTSLLPSSSSWNLYSIKEQQSEVMDSITGITEQQQQQQSEVMDSITGITEQQQQQQQLQQQSFDISYDKKLLNEIEYASQNPNNKNFGKLEYADDWDCIEVCWWLSTIHLDKYISIFHSQIIDGSILLRDLDEIMLTKELNIKRLHVRKLMREIQKLREISLKLKVEPKKDSSNDALKIEIENLKKENDQLKEENKKLKQIQLQKK